MSILDTIEKIQKKPEHTRRQIMYVTLGMCMILVFGIWVINFRNTLNTNSETASIATTTSPLDYIRNVWNDITKK